MSADFQIYRGEVLEQFSTLGRLDLFKDIFHVAVSQLNLNWLPDIIGRAGLYIDSKNRDEVRYEIDVLDQYVHSLGNQKEKKFLAEVVRKMRAAMQQLFEDDALTGHVG
jgi:hypothetical protein